jgi:hypothetical protein
MPKPLHEKDFFVIPDEENKTIIIGTMKRNANLKLNKKRALELVGIIRRCVQRW